jgi:hypothetical protein
MASQKKTAVTLSPRRSGLSKAARELLSRVRVAVSPEVIFGLEPNKVVYLAGALLERLSPKTSPNGEVRMTNDRTVTGL